MISEPIFAHSMISFLVRKAVSPPCGFRIRIPLRGNLIVKLPLVDDSALLVRSETRIRPCVVVTSGAVQKNLFVLIFIICSHEPPLFEENSSLTESTFVLSKVIKTLSPGAKDAPSSDAFEIVIAGAGAANVSRFLRNSQAWTTS